MGVYYFVMDVTGMFDMEIKHGNCSDIMGN